jgi:hypothetical protein
VIRAGENFNKEIKKFLRGKTLIKNFFNTKVVLVTTISPSKAKRNDFLYIFAPGQK